MPKFTQKVTIRAVDAKAVKILWELVADDDNFLLEHSSYEEWSPDTIAEPEPVAKPGKRYRYAHGRRDKGIRGTHLALIQLSKGPKSLEDLQSVFVEHGFADTSVYGVMTLLRQDGYARKRSDGRWEQTAKQMAMPLQH